jgi:hypothetical protein
MVAAVHPFFWLRLLCSLSTQNFYLPLQKIA